VFAQVHKHWRLKAKMKCIIRESKVEGVHSQNKLDDDKVPSFLWL